MHLEEARERQSAKSFLRIELRIFFEYLLHFLTAAEAMAWWLEESLWHLVGK